MRSSVKTLMACLFILSMALFLTNCGGSSGDGGTQPPQTNITGSWTVDEGPATSSTLDCNDNSHYIWTAAIVHDGVSNNFTITPIGGQTNDVGTTYTGTISGSHLSYSGAATDPDCDSLSISVGLDLNAAGTVANGSANWTCSWVGGSCSGNTQIVATKN